MKKINKKPTVTVAISAFNEEKNIKPFLESVIKQNQNTFFLKEIWVYSDGSTDNTVAEAKKVVSKKIKLFIDLTRKGKSARLNQIYKKLTTDFLVQSDADVVFAHEFVIRDMIQPLIHNKDVAMCGGNPLPIKATTFTEKAVNCSTLAYIPLRKSLRGGNNVFSVDGRILSYKKELIKKMYIPEVDVTANDAFTYYTCLTLGWKYNFVESGIVLYRSPQSLKDQIKQNTRFLAMPVKMSKYFNQKLVKREKYIPLYVLIINTGRVFIKHPILSTYIFLVNLYCRLKMKSVEKTLTGKWPVVFSTKNFSN